MLLGAEPIGVPTRAHQIRRVCKFRAPVYTSRSVTKTCRMCFVAMLQLLLFLPEPLLLMHRLQLNDWHSTAINEINTPSSELNIEIKRGRHLPRHTQPCQKANQTNSPSTAAGWVSTLTLLIAASSATAYNTVNRHCSTLG